MNKQDSITVQKQGEYQPAENYTAYLDCIGGADVMPIGGYYGPFTSKLVIDGKSAPQYVNDEVFKLIADCGINLITKTDDQYGTDDESIIKALKLSEKYGIGYFVIDKALIDYVYQRYPNELNHEKAAKTLTELSRYPGFAGLSIIDEPTSSKFDRMAEEQELYYGLNIPGTHTYINLYPTYASGKQLSGTDMPTTYRQHLEDFIQKCKPRYVSYDHYVFDPGRTAEEYFENMSIIREVATAHKLPFWSFIQAGPAFIAFPDEPYYPTEAQLLWNVHTSLAYGAKGIQYYPLMNPIFKIPDILSKDLRSCGIIGFDGSPTRWYYYAQKANRQILAVDHILMHSANLGVIAYGATAEAEIGGGVEVKAEKEFRQFKSLAGGEALVGCFDYRGDTVLYLVNYSMKCAQNFKLGFSGECGIEVIYGAESYKKSGSSLDIELAAGEGALIRII